jgi:cytochrome c553
MRIACLCLLFAATSAFAQAKFEDTMAQRTLACTACHGKEGRAAPDGYYPRIAGKPAGYLYNQLLNFREGRRHYGLMTRLIDPLSDAYLFEIAHYFAALDLPYPPPQPATLPAAALERGRAIATQGDAASKVPACVQCHGERLTGALPAVPGLLGVSRDYLNAQLGAWHAPDCMAEIAKRLSPEDLTSVAAWLAAQPLPADAHPAGSLPREMPLTCGSATPPKAAS